MENKELNVPDLNADKQEEMPTQKTVIRKMGPWHQIHLQGFYTFMEHEAEETCVRSTSCEQSEVLAPRIPPDLSTPS